MVVRQTELAELVRKEVETLAREFEGMFAAETVERCARELAGQFEQAPIRDYIPILVYKSTRDRLRDAVRDAPPRAGTMDVLFVCRQNAGRSQMAAAWAIDLSDGRLLARSAGTMPARHVHPTVVRAMAEAGIDLSGERLALLTEESVQRADVVVTMGCGDACPVIPAKLYYDWRIDDPADQPLDEVRRIRDDVRAHVDALLLDLLPPESMLASSAGTS